MSSVLHILHIKLYPRYLIEFKISNFSLLITKGLQETLAFDLLRELKITTLVLDRLNLRLRLESSSLASSINALKALAEGATKTISSAYATIFDLTIPNEQPILMCI